jgi:RNA polymerase sigma factor (sigma-70 family)
VESRRRADRFAVSVSLDFLKRVGANRSFWYETEEEIEAGLEWGRQKDRLLRWVRRQMARRLSKRERRCVEMYFFKGMTYLEVANATGTDASSAHRAVARSLRKLRSAARRARCNKPEPQA